MIARKKAAWIPMARGTRDKTSENAFWFAIEALLVIAIVAGAISVSVANYHVIIDRIRMLETHSLISGVRVDLQQAYSVTGEWPTTPRASFIKHNEYGHVTDIAFAEAGVVIFEIDATTTHGRGSRLAYRPAESNTGSSIVWTCGYAAPPPGFSIAGANRSDIDPLLLPASCRHIIARN